MPTEDAVRSARPPRATAEDIAFLHDLLGFPDSRQPSFLVELDGLLTLAARADPRLRTAPHPNEPPKTWQRYWHEIPRSDDREFRRAERFAAKVCYARFRHIRSRAGLRNFDAATLQRHMFAAGIQVGASFIRAGNSLQQRHAMQAVARRRRNASPYLPVPVQGEWGSGGGWDSSWDDIPSTGNWSSMGTPHML